MFENGLEFIRADFHLHTQKDKEFKYTDADDEFIKRYVQALKDADIGIGVITNHNKFDKDEYRAIRKSAKKENIFILPGVELSVKEGANGIHTLIVFNPDEWLINNDNHIQTFLTAAFAGISNPENRNTRCNYDLKNMFESLEAYGKDYFVIFAHVDQDSGLFVECKGGLLESLAGLPSFRKRVLGLQKSRTYDNLNQFKRIFDYVPALIEGSDPKSIGKIGKGELRTYLKVGDFSYSTIKFALVDFPNRVCAEKPIEKHGYIESISFQGGKFDEETIHFSSELNTLIGIRGSGKSAILESIRYVLEIDAHADKNYKESLVKNIFGSGGKALLNVIDKHGRKYTISRIYGERTNVIDEDGQDLNINPMSVFDGVQYFGQKDLSNSADHENELLTKLVGKKADNDNLEKHLKELVTMFEHLSSVNQIPIKISELATKKAEIEHKMSIYKEKGVEEKLKKQSSFTSDKTKFISLRTEVDTILQAIKQVYDKYSMITTDFNEYKSDYNNDLLMQLKKLITEINNELGKINTSITQITSIKTQINDTITQLSKRAESLADEFAAIKREINDETIDADAFVIMQTEYLEIKDKLGKLDKALKSKSEFEQLFLTAVRKRNEDLNGIFRQYQAEAEIINEAQKELEIKIEFKGDRESFKNQLKADFKGTGVTDAKYSELSKEFSDYVDIVADWVLKDGEKLKEILSTSVYSKFIDRITEQYKDLIEFQVPDKVEIFYHGKLLHKHSLGQRASALILFILTQNNNDIIVIDQPEDDLDNKVIYDEVITAIAKTKKNIQFIFATHNANIPVLGDAERVLVVDFQDTKIDVSQGNIDMSDTQKQIVDIMEGGREAFNKRQLIYTSWR